MSHPDAAAVEPVERAAHSDHASGPGADHGTGKKWFIPAVTALGIVYGDIGTSPMYALQVALGSTGHASPTPTDVLGIVSLIFWAIVLIIAFKYVTVVMRADNEGEGGTLTLLSLVLPAQRLRKPGFPILLVLAIVGASFVYGDGVITPAMSVLSAMEGLKVAAPTLSSAVLPLTLIVLVGLFSIQFRGTGKIGGLFGPVMILWFGTIGTLGFIEIMRTPAVLAAVDPRYAIHLLTHGGKNVLAIVGAAFLALTGGEALYADMGHVGAPAIRRAWFAVVMPALLLSYFGQGALILAEPEKASNPFFELAPSWGAIPLVVLAAMASIIASQAMITGAFSLTRQAMQMRLMPRMQIRSTSGRHQGQIYIGAVNWLMMAASISVVLGFRTSNNLAAAYGIAVSGTMLVTSILLYNVVRKRWHWPMLAAGLLCGVLTIIDGTFLHANATKIVEGGWLPLAIGTLLAFLMMVWRSGAIEVQRRLEEMTVPFSEFLASLNEEVVARIPGTAVVFTRAEHHTSPILVQQVRHNQVLHQNIILMTIEPVGRPIVHARERFEITELGHGFHRVIVKIGFLQTPDLPAYVKGLVRLGLKCAKDEIHYLVAYEHVVRKPRHSHFPLFLWHIFSLMTKIGVRLTDFLNVPEDDVFEVGIKVQI
ncbi:MAG TPA: KUP/HAK/KT family potassium transporter [Alphaproteobacteria bacterium]|nr:KUP/HAK/KT family potassium transporter [Alphaproteobacteria bacterium]